jgi:hypothetical protein
MDEVSKNMALFGLDFSWAMLDRRDAHCPQTNYASPNLKTLMKATYVDSQSRIHADNRGITNFPFLFNSVVERIFNQRMTEIILPGEEGLIGGSLGHLKRARGE